MNRSLPHKVILISLLIGIHCPLHGQEKYLIEDIEVQYNINHAINSMYNFDFETAAKEYRWLEQSYPWHPLPYFLLGLNEWWKILPNLHITAHDKAFLSHMKIAKTKAEVLYKKGAWQAESIIFLLLIHGLKGRFYGEREEWISAIIETRQAIKYLKKAREGDYLSIETLAGEGLYNYYIEWLPSHQRVARYLRLFFERGDKEKGIKQLEEAAYNAFYTRIEAQHFLAAILDGEKKYPEALRMMAYLTEKYPNNGYFQREYANMLYKAKKFDECKVVSEDMLRKVREQKPGYGASQGRYAHFFLGQLYESSPMGLAAAVSHYEQVVRYATAMQILSYSYTIVSILGLARFHEETEGFAQAEERYEQAKDLSKRKSPLRKEAKDGLDRVKRRRR